MSSEHEAALSERHERIHAHAVQIVGRYIAARCHFDEPSAQRDTFHDMPAKGRANMIDLAILLASEIDDAVREAMTR